jgi:uncharacterized protein (TIGR00730 family)
MPIAVTLDVLLLAMPDVMHVFLAAWLVAVGGCVGSFVNVVALRLPAGIGIARSGSRCPTCLRPIRWYDNIPLISWLALRGRCRVCGVWIPLRYPLVELLMAGIFLTLALGEGMISGRNLPEPLHASLHYRLTPLATWSIYGYHIVLLVTLFTAALIAWDGLAVPWPIFLPAAAIGVLAPIWWPQLHPVSFAGGPIDGGWLSALTTTLCGAFVGGLMGACAWPALHRWPHRLRAAPCVAVVAALTGAFLGWQAVGMVVMLSAVAYLMATIIAPCSPRLRAGPWSAYLLVSTVIFLVNWRSIVDWIPFAGPDASIGVPFVLALIVAGVSVLSGRIAGNNPREIAHPMAQGDVMTSADPEKNRKAILDSRSYMPVENDAEFLQQPELRPVRVQLELLKPELGFSREEVDSTIVVFGGTQVVEAERARIALDRARMASEEAPDDARRQREVQRLERIVAKADYYDAARQFARIVSSACQIDGKCDYVIVTGGGPGIMEAANRGAFDVGAKSIGLNVTLPAEQSPNSYITPELCFQFHYFAMRKMHFLMRAKALVVFPGGFGTLDELFDALTLRQTERMQEIPIILFGRDYWNRVIDFQFLADEGVIADEHLDLISYAETPADAWDIITRFHGTRGKDA